MFNLSNTTLNLIFFRRQIALKALSERLSKSHLAQDKTPLIPKSNLKTPTPSVPHGKTSPVSPQPSKENTEQQPSTSQSTT